MSNKLHINASQGVIDVEGDPEFVTLVYNDFKGEIAQLLARTISEELDDTESDSRNGTHDSSPRASRKRTKKRQKRYNEAGKKNQPAAYKPKLDRSVSLAGLKDFYEKYAPKNNRERVLLLCKFLQQNGVDPCTADQIYTCYTNADPKNLPKAYAQALIDTRGKAGYIDYESLDAISVSTLGEHHLLTSSAGG